MKNVRLVTAKRNRPPLDWHHCLQPKAPGCQGETERSYRGVGMGEGRERGVPAAPGSVEEAMWRCAFPPRRHVTAPAMQFIRGAAPLALTLTPLRSCR
jgi:hypothetical protein